MKKLLAACALAAALIVPASAQQPALTPGGLPLGMKPVRYELSVRPDADALTFSGSVTIEIEVAAPTREIVLNALDLQFDAVTLDGREQPAVSFDAAAQTARLSFARPFSAGRHVLSIEYRGVINRQAHGLFAVDYASDRGPERMLATQFEAADARRFLPCFDEPGLKAMFELSVIAPESRVVISNMPEAVTERLGGGMKRVRFAPSPLMSSYLLFLAIGDLERIATTVNGVEISVITKRGDAEHGRFALESAAALLPYFDAYFATPYPLPKLDMIAVPGGGGFGAMENWGAILYFERVLLLDPALASEGNRQGVFNVVAHEIAHQWFGNLVTMSWWDDLWLNEGFASWMQGKATAHFYPQWNNWMQAQGRRQAAMEQDSRATTHPVVQNIGTVAEAEEAFDNITYQKGRAIIRMLESFVGEDHFRDGVRAYMREHAYGNARTANLWSAVEAASGQPMRQIAEDFTFQPGVPLISAEAASCVDGRRVLTLHQGRYGLDEASRAPLRWRAPISVRLLGQNETLSAVTDADGAATVTLPGCGAFVVNPDQVGYYRVDYRRASFARLAHEFARLAPADQLGLLYDTRALGVSGQAQFSAFYNLARRTPAQADPLVWGLIATELTETNYLYAGLPSREAYRGFARALLAPVLARIGWDKAAGEADNVAIARTRLIAALSTLGDPGVAAEARRRFAANAMPGAIRQAVLNAVGRGADTRAFEELLARARASAGTLEKASYYEALMNPADAGLARRALSHVFDADVPVTLTANLIGIAAIQHPNLAWRFALEHPAEMAVRLDSLSRAGYMPGLTQRGIDAELLQGLRLYIDQNVPADVRRGAEAAYLHLSERIALRAERLPELDAWIARPRRAD